MYYIAIVLIILLIYFLSWNNSIDGFWRVSDEFKNEANIDELMLYFSPDGGYCTMVVDGQVEFNDVVNFSMSNKTWFGKDNVVYSCKMDKDIPGIPTNVRIEVEFSTGLMQITSGEKIYALLYKDNEASSLKLELTEDSESI